MWTLSWDWGGEVVLMRQGTERGDDRGGEGALDGWG